MSCVIGVVDGMDVILGADSAGSHGDEIHTFPNRKVFARGPYVFGVCGSYRVGQVLRYRAELPEPPAAWDSEAFMVRELVPAIHAAVMADDVVATGGELPGVKTMVMIGCRGELWCVGPDLTVLRGSGFCAIGSGRLRAYGALYALHAAGVEPARRRLELALEATAVFTSTVRPPWQFVATATGDGGVALDAGSGMRIGPAS